MSLKKEKVKLELLEELNKRYEGLLRREIKRQKEYLSKLIHQDQGQGELYVH